MTALELEPDQRRTFLAGELEGEAPLLEEALRLLGELEAGEAGPGGDGQGLSVGDYDLLEEIGRGGVGVVYRAHHVTLGRDVAVKLLSLTASADARQVDRFRREARTGGRLDHPSIVQVHDVGQERGQWYIASELVEGHDVAEEIRLQADGRDPDRWLLPPHGDRAYVPRITELIARVAEALQTAHSAAVVHRDVKPQNLLLDRDGQIKLADFGLARDESLGSITLTGTVEGTPYYMSPEQVRGQKNRIDERTDIYSLGVVLYELLTLRRPFEGTTSAQVIDRIANRDAPPLRKVNPRIPRDLALVCERAMNKDASERYASAGGFAADLRRFLNHESVTAKGVGVVSRVRRHVRRRRVAYGALLLIATIGLGSALVTWELGRRADRSAWRSDVQRIIEGQDDLGALGGDLIALQSSAQRLESDPRSSADDLRMTAQALDAVGRHVAALTEEGQLLVRQGTGASGKGELAPSESRFYLGLQRLATAQSLRPDDESLLEASLEQTYRPRLLVAGFHASGTGPRSVDRVTLAEVLGDGSLGPSLSLSPDADTGSAVVPGIYRITAFSKTGVAETTRTLKERSRTYTYEPIIRPSDEVTRSMVFIPAGTARVGLRTELPWGREPWQAWREISHEAFWISPVETTNGEYARFVVATGAEEPVHWESTPEEVRPEDWDSMPVFGVPFRDAQAYAHWNGCRLASDIEWQVAMRGREGFGFPWGDDESGAPGLVRMNMPALPEPLPELDRRPWKGYLGSCGPVGSAPGDISPFKVLDGLGSVREWTETPVQTSLLDWPEMSPSTNLEYGMRIIRGNQWNTPLTESLETTSMATMYATAAGIRCAKSHFLPNKK